MPQTTSGLLPAYLIVGADDLKRRLDGGLLSQADYDYYHNNDDYDNHNNHNHKGNHDHYHEGDYHHRKAHHNHYGRAVRSGHNRVCAGTGRTAGAGKTPQH